MRRREQLSTSVAGKAGDPPISEYEPGWHSSALARNLGFERHQIGFDHVDDLITPPVQVRPALRSSPYGVSTIWADKPT